MRVRSGYPTALRATLALLIGVFLLPAAAWADTFQFSQPSFDVAESVGDATITVTRIGTGAGAISVDYETFAGSARPGDDFGEESGTLFFANGQMSRTFTVNITGDTRDEPSEALSVVLSNPQGAGAALGAPASAAVNILDDDPVQININDVSVSEEDTGIVFVTFTVALTDILATDVTFDWTSGSPGTATPNVDYQAASATGVVISAGQQFKEVTINVIADDIDELDETFTVTLSNIVGVATYDIEGVGTIVDDDAPCIRIRNMNVAEPDPATGDLLVQLEVYLSDLSGAYQTSPQPVTVDFGTRDGSAEFGDDYSTPGGQVTIPANTTSAYIPLTIIADLDVEGSENFFVELTDPINATFCDDEGEVTILDNDTPGQLQFSGAAFSVNENEASGRATITVVRVGGIGGSVSADWAATAGTATAGNDFTVANGTVSFGPGEVVRTFDVLINNDNIDELDETVLLALTNPQGGATLGTPDQATLTIVDDDPTPQLSVNDVSVTEGDAGTVNAQFTVSVPNPSYADITFGFTTADGSANAGSDYNSASGGGTIPAGSTSTTVTVQVVGDLLTEGAETFNLNINNPSANAAIADNQGVGTINDNDPIPQISIDDISFAEGTGGFTIATFTVTLSNQSQQNVTVNWSTAAGSATANVDYATASGTVSFGAGITSQPVAISVFADAIDEGDEIFYVNLATPGNATIADAQGVGTIVDDEGTPAISIADVSLTEGNAGTLDAVFTVTLSGSSASNVTVNYATSDGSALAPLDYSTRTGSLVFTPGQVSQQILVPVVGDTIDELDENFTVTLSGAANANIADGTAVGTIQDNDNAPALSINSSSATEGNNVIFTVTLSGASGQTVSVNYASSDGSALSGADYNAVTGTLNFPPNTVSQQISVPTIVDSLNEAAETFTVTLSAPSNASIAPGAGAGTGTINDDDPLPAININDVSVTEGDAGTVNATFTISLGAASGRNVSVNFATANGSASAGADFTGTSGSRTFLPGETVKTVEVVVSADLLDEDDETFFLNLSGASNGTISDAQGLGTIVDDDATPTLSIDDVVIVEGNSGTSNAVFTVTLSALSGRNVSVSYTTADGSAVAPGDYSSSTGSMNISAGSISGTISVPVTGDPIDEGDESFAVNLSLPVNAAILDGAGLGTIQDDDNTPQASISDVTVAEGNAGTVNATFTVTLDRPSAQAISINWSTSDGSASAGFDYTSASSSIAFAAGDTSEQFTVQVLGDRVDEADEIFNVNLSTLSAVDLPDPQATGTITDDDTAGFLISPLAGLVTTEAGLAANFTVRLTSIPTAPVTISLSSSDTTEGDVSPSGLTFQADVTALDPQTVTITGVDDLVADGNILYSVITGAAVSGDGNYSGLNPADPSAINSDNDTPGITVSPTAGLVTTEAGGTATFSVVLNTVPTANVTIALSSSDTTEGTVAPPSLVFTPGDALSAQFVTVTGVDDAIIDGAIGYTIITAPAVSTDPNYGGRNAEDVSVTNNDDEAQPQISISDVTVTEGNSGPVNATFNVTLNAVSAQTVSVQYASANGTAVAGSDYTAVTGSLTFSPGEQTKPVTVQVSGDRVDESDETFVINLSAPTNATILDPQGSGTISDDDTAGFTLAPTSGLVTTEAGGTAQFTVVLTSVPTADVTITIASSDTTEGTVSAASLLFTPGDALTPKSVTVTGVNDTLIDGNIDYVITTGAAASADPAYAGIDPANVNVTNNDNDSAGISVTPTTGLVTTEAGGTATFSVVLNTTPSADVVVGISSSDLTEGSVSTSSLTFTAATWNVAQIVTVTGIDDPEADGNIGYSVITAAATSSDPNYNSLNPSDVGVTNNDNDNAGIVVTPSSGLVTSEGGGQATFTVRLSSQPTANVTIALSSSDASEGTVSPSSLLFTPALWNTDQTVTVTGADDTVIDGNVNYTIVTAPAQSSDSTYNGRNAADVSVTNTDDDSAAIIITPTSGLVTSEAGINAIFTVRLGSTPTVNVTINLSSSDLTEGTVSPASVVIAPADWNTPVIVTVSGEDDALADGDIAYSIVTAAAVSADANYSGLNAADVSVMNNDNDTPGITVTPTAGLETNEGGSTSTFRIVLNTQPTASVTIDLSSDDASEGTVSPAFVTFTDSNWDEPQTITVTGVDDTTADGDIAFSIITAAAVSSDPNYGGRNSSDVAVVNLDDDTPGITIMLGADLVTTEAGGTATFRIVLNTSPTSDVTIDLSSSAPGEGSVSQPSVTFTPANALIPQTITVTGLDDPIDDGDVPYYIVTAPASSTDPNYANRNGADVPVTNIDDDGSGIIVDPTSGLVTTEAGGTATFTVRLLTPPTANVTIAISSNDGTEGSASPASLTFTPANGTDPQTVTVTGLNDSIDDGDVPYMVLTGTALSADPVYNGMTAADVSVTNIDDEGTPQILINDISVVEGNSGVTAATFTVSLSTPTTAAVTVDFATANGTAQFGSDYTPRSSTVTIPAGASSATLTVDVLGDIANESSETFLVNLGNPVNAAIGKGQGVGTILDDDGLPVIVSFNPASACQNGPGFTLSITGTGFVDGAEVLWNGVPRAATFVSATQLRVEVLASDLTTAGAIPVAVQNPGGGGSSLPKLFTVAEDEDPPVVDAPEAITLVQTTCQFGLGGTSGATSPLVAAFLRAATASDGCSAVTALPPQVDGQDVDDNTFFGGGPTEVTFRFRDASGRIGTAVSTITVELYGDLDVNYVVEATDLVIMANHLVKNIAVGQPPFLAPAFLADLNEDRRIDAVDLTILAHYLVGNIDCLPHLRP
jgi:hypothetical protein